MKDTKKILDEIDKYLKKTKKNLIKDGEFENLHEEILIFCKHVFNKKSDYKNIDIEYPNKFILIIKRCSGQPDFETPNKKMRKKNRQKLTGDIIRILEQAKKVYKIKLKLEKR
ncbi:MAG: hypothetical protein WC349_03370 [Patescibacteria group bacterium]